MVHFSGFKGRESQFIEEIFEQAGSSANWNYEDVSGAENKSFYRLEFFISGWVGKMGRRKMAKVNNEKPWKRY